jgi:hypothetical protein
MHGANMKTRTDVMLMCFWIEVYGWTPTVYIMIIFNWTGITVCLMEKQTATLVLPQAIYNPINLDRRTNYSAHLISI